MSRRVLATREGLGGKVTASGYRIENNAPFVALPSRAALWDWVMVMNPATNKTCRARVLDIGPHFTDDHAYVFGDARPRAETPALRTNGAGIDLGERVWSELGMTDNGFVLWWFVWEFNAEI